MAAKNKNGLILLSKPYQIVSNKVLQYLKIIMNKGKLGYSGTLDPLAIGCLPILFNSHTVFSECFLKQKKIYIAELILFQITNTYDADGNIIKNGFIYPISIEQILKKISNFIGYIYQSPPLFSSIKYKGDKLYVYAKKNSIAKIKKRCVHIFKVQLISYKSKKIILSITCSSGTYIRSFISDIGYLINCGAFLSQLNRTNIGLHSQSSSVSINQLKTLKKNSVNTSYINYFMYSNKSIFHIM